MMEKEINDDVLFDYHLGLVNDQTKAACESFLEKHPEKRAVLADFAQIEQSYQTMAFEGPSEAVLSRVRDAARQEIGQSQGMGFGLKAWLNQLRFAPALGAMAVMAIVAFGFFALSPELGVQPTQPVANLDDLAQDQTQTTKAANFSGALTKSVLPQVDGTARDRALQSYQKGMSFYHQSRFEEANELFETTLQTDPHFVKKDELIHVWGKSLEFLGREGELEKKLGELNQK